MSDLIASLGEQVLEWSANNGRHSLPWRRVDITPYEVWVSEVMLQQTQVSRVVPYYEKFLERFPTVQSLAQSTWEEFLPFYAGLGYYARGRNMLKAAQTVVTKHAGTFPRDETALRSLPGVGPYTAKAILSFGYGKNHLAFDTNQQRIFGRVLEGNRKAALDSAAIEQAIPPETDFRTLNGALMDFANAICTKKPKCEICPLRNICKYAATEGQLEESVTKRKLVLPLERTQVILILHKQHQEYYSADPHHYEPFRLPLSLTTRAQIKEYFRRIYRLELAVRPPHNQGYLDEQPVLLVNAQILLGTPTFSTFSKTEVKPLLAELQTNLLHIQC